MHAPPDTCAAGSGRMINRSVVMTSTLKTTAYGDNSLRTKRRLLVGSPMQPHLTIGPLTPSRPSLGRVAFAVLIAFALFLSFFHGWSPIGTADASSLSSTVVTIDTAPNAPAHHAPVHSDHCLSHLVSQPWQEPVGEPAQLGGTAYLVHAELLWDGLSGVSPFKPPRA